MQKPKKLDLHESTDELYAIDLINFLEKLQKENYHHTQAKICFLHRTKKWQTDSSFYTKISPEFQERLCKKEKKHK